MIKDNIKIPPCPPKKAIKTPGYITAKDARDLAIRQLRGPLAIISLAKVLILIEEAAKQGLFQITNPFRDTNISYETQIVVFEKLKNAGYVITQQKNVSDSVYECDTYIISW